MPNSIVDTIHQVIDQNDPTQKAIGLLAVLVDNKLNSISTNISKMDKRLDEQEEKLDNLDHGRSCPFGMPQKIAELEKQLEPFTFVTRYPKLAFLMLVGAIALMSLGIDKIINLL